MPLSMEGHISWVGKILRERKPVRVLDVGIGTGFYGVLTRQLVDWIRVRENGHLKKNWKTELIGIEIFPDYIQDIQRWIYNNIIIDDITKIDISILGKFDIIMFMDIIEHLEYEDAKRIVSELKKISKLIIISTPHGFVQQNIVCENKHEIHKTGWVNPMHENGKNAHYLSELGEIIEEAYFSPCDVVLMKGDLK